MDSFYKANWRISVQKGWHSLVEPLIDYCILNDIKILQIKEKLGGLRFYTEAAPKEFYKIVRDAEDQSYTVCEVCGAPGKLLNDKGWWKTRCEEHA